MDLRDPAGEPDVDRLVPLRERGLFRRMRQRNRLRMQQAGRGFAVTGRRHAQRAVRNSRHERASGLGEAGDRRRIRSSRATRHGTGRIGAARNTGDAHSGLTFPIHFPRETNEKQEPS